MELLMSAEPQTCCIVRVAQRAIHVVELGEGPALLMLHGGGPGASGTPNFARNVEVLSRRFRLIVPDLPGYGRSTKGVDRNDPFGDLAGSMLGLLDALNVGKAHVLGNSLGGAAALRLTLEAPERVDRLVLLGPGGIDTSRRPPTEGLLHLLDYYSGEGPTRQKCEQFLRQDLVFDGAALPDSLIDARYQASLDPEVIANPPLVRPKSLPDARVLDLTLDPRLSALRAPTLVLWGMEDRVNPASGARSLQERMPNCDLYLFRRTGHWVQWERAAEFNAATIAHLSPAV
jgi:4,5:9,10-diseco-3-hydroxy-5,9,17-trioxoandrosta-1(10),2-diene-4-oate hydrolase